MATTRTQSQIQADLNNAKNTYIGGCTYKNESTISYSNISHYGLELTSTSWRNITGPDNEYGLVKPTGPKITKVGMSMQDSKIRFYCKSCGGLGSNEYTPRAIGSGTYITQGIFLQIDWNGKRLKESLSNSYLKSIYTNAATLYLPGYNYSSGWYRRCTLSSSYFGFTASGSSLTSTTFGSISHNRGSVDSSAVSRYQTELNLAVARDNAISAFDNLNLSTTPNNTTATEAKRQLDIILTNAGSSYEGYTSRLAKYNTYVANLSTTEQLNISVGSLRELHTNISGTMLPGKVSRYTDIHTRGTGEYNTTKNMY